MDETQIQAVRAKIKDGYEGRVLEPLHDWVYVTRIHRENRTKSGIVLAGKTLDEQYEYEVVAVGPGCINDRGERDPMSVKVGDVVLADGLTAGFILDAVIHYTLRDTQIVGIVRGAVPEWMDEKKGSTAGFGRAPGDKPVKSLVQTASRMPKLSS